MSSTEKLSKREVICGIFNVSCSNKFSLNVHFKRTLKPSWIPPIFPAFLHSYELYHLTFFWVLRKSYVPSSFLTFLNSFERFFYILPSFLIILHSFERSFCIPLSWLLPAFFWVHKPSWIFLRSLFISIYKKLLQWYFKRFVFPLIHLVICG